LAKPKGVDAWKQRFEELKKYINENGDPYVPTFYPDNRALGRWVSAQRNMYKRFYAGEKCNSLSQGEMQRRLALLNLVGFSWHIDRPSGSESKRKNKSQENDDAWEQHFEELKKCIAEHGHAQVTTKYRANNTLGGWLRG
jgi:hypothetical protein